MTADANDLKERLNEVFTDMQNQANLTLFDKTKPLDLFFRVDRHKEWMRCEVCSENNMMSYGHFTVAARIIDGTVVLQTHINAAISGNAASVIHHLKAINVLVEVCNLIDKTYCQTWTPGPYREWIKTS